MPQQPSIGRIVHYALPHGPNLGVFRPAIIVNTFPGSMMANLHVFLDGSNDTHTGADYTPWRTSVEYSEDPKPGTWHWPLRAA